MREAARVRAERVGDLSAAPERQFILPQLHHANRSATVIAERRK
jgi:hypothetical protein